MVAAFKVSFRRAPAEKPAPLPRVSRLARLLALAHRVDEEIRSGAVHDLAHAARLAHVTRARMTQIANLVLLAPDLQELFLDGHAGELGERDIRPVLQQPSWTAQRDLWRRIQEDQRR